MEVEGKGKEIARCLGYQHAFHDNAGMDGLVGDIVSSIVKSDEDSDVVSGRNGDSTAAAAENNGAQDVDMWHLRSLAIQPGGLLNSHGRKLGWIKLAGADDLFFKREQVNIAMKEKLPPVIPGRRDRTYEQIQKHLEQEMDPSRWHIQRERRRLRKEKKQRNENSTTQPSSSAISHASSTNDLSSIGSESGSSTPLTANLNASHAGTPKSVTFQGIVGPNSAGAPSFTAFSNERRNKDSSPASKTSCPSVTVVSTLDTSFDSQTLDSPSSNNNYTALAPSPISLSSPAAHPEDQLSSKFKWDLTPKSYLQYSQKYHRKHKQQMKPRPKKDRRPQELKLLVQIASSSFYLLQCQQSREESNVEFQFYPGMQDLIAVLLLHLESPSLTSLLLKQIVESHLWMYCSVANETIDDGDESFTSCIDAIDDDSSSEEDADDDSEKCSPIGRTRDLDVLSLSFFPLLQILDKELHDHLLKTNEGGTLLNNQALIVGEVLRKWISSWFCCHDTLPLGVVSCIVDFFLASHPSMPLYLSMAILCHPIHRDKFLCLLSYESPPNDKQPPQSVPQDVSLNTMLENLFLNLSQDLSSWKITQSGGDVDGCDNDHSDADELLVEFMDEAMVTAVSYMKQIPPQELFSLVKEYRNGVLMSYLKPQDHESAAPPSPWTTRPTAPTDYNMIQRMFADTNRGAVSRFVLSRRATEKCQVAFDASGLLPRQIMLEPSTLKSRTRTPAKAVMLGIALYVAVQLIQPEQNPLDSATIGLLSEDNFAVPLKLAISTGLQSPKLPRTLDMDPSIETSPVSILSRSNDSEATHDVPSYSIEDVAEEPEEDRHLLGHITAEKKKDTKTKPSAEEPRKSIGDDWMSRPSSVSIQDKIKRYTARTRKLSARNKLLGLTNSEDAPASGILDTDVRVFDDSPPIAAEDIADNLEDVMATMEDVEVYDPTPDTIPSDTDGWKKDVQSSEEESQQVSETLYAVEADVEAGEDTPYPPHQDDESNISSISYDEREQYQHLLGKHSMTEERTGATKPSTVSVHHKVKGYKARTRKLRAGIKKHALQGLKGLKVGYIALVEDDDFFL